MLGLDILLGTETDLLLTGPQVHRPQEATPNRQPREVRHPQEVHQPLGGLYNLTTPQSTIGVNQGLLRNGVGSGRLVDTCPVCGRISVLSITMNWSKPIVPENIRLQLAGRDEAMLPGIV